MRSAAHNGMGSITVRKYNDADGNRVGEITEKNYYEIFKGFREDTVKVILDGESIIGWIHLSLPESSLYSGFAFIYIAPKHRRKGIGTHVYKLAESRLKAAGCNWWSSYPESAAADNFALSVGFDYTNTNSYLVHSGKTIPESAAGIRVCRIEDYPTAPDIWSEEYAAMHLRIGIPYVKRELSPEQRSEEFEDFRQNLNDHFVIEADGKIVGVGSLFRDNSGIGSIAVGSSYSGKGYGTRLAAFLTNECIRRGCIHPCIYCETGNDNAMHIYKKLGYEEQSRESIAVKN